MNAVETVHLSKTYENFALRDISLTLQEGYVLGIIGENGAGKTTLFRLLLGMARPDEGQALLFGQSGARAREEVGVVMDDGAFPTHLTAPQLGRVFSRIYRRWDGGFYEELLRTLEIPGATRFGEMSRGTKMKLSLAAALAHRPRLLLLDEPTGGLDPVVRTQVVEMLSDFTRDESHSILISSHIVSDLERLCDYVAFLRQGRLLLLD